MSASEGSIDPLDGRTRTAIPHYATVAPLVWSLVGLAVLESLAVHLFLVIRWPSLAWPLLVLSGASVGWLVRWIPSFKRLPHRLARGRLELNEGNLRSASVPLADGDCARFDEALNAAGIMVRAGP